MDVTRIFNLALNAVGARSNVASPTERSREAEVCSLWYPLVTGQVFAAAPWPELTRLASLEILDERDYEEEWVDTNARPGYQFAYAVPEDMARPQYLTNFDRFLLTNYGGEERAIASNTEAAILAYTSNSLSPGLWGPSLQMAIVYALASHIVMPLSGKVARAKQMVDQANATILAAREVSSNISNEQYDFVPDWLTARGYSGSSVSQRYVYPMGDLLTVSNV